MSETPIDRPDDEPSKSPQQLDDEAKIASKTQKALDEGILANPDVYAGGDHPDIAIDAVRRTLGREVEERIVKRGFRRAAEESRGKPLIHIPVPEIRESLPRRFFNTVKRILPGTKK